jgi:hypothetical protein
MTLKRITAIFILTVMLMLSACSANSSGTALPKADAVLNGKIMHIYEDSFLLAGQGASDLYMVSTELAIYDEDSQVTDAADLKAGQTVEIGFSGLVMESYPAQLAEPIYLRITGQGDDLVGLYQAVLDDLWNVDPGLNGDIDTMAFDLSKVSNLSDSEKSALIYIVSGSHNIFGIAGTFDELAEQGYINKDQLYFENGLLFQVEVTDTKKDGFVFNASKWRSGDGAYFYQDCKAFKNSGTWEYAVGSEAIS